MPRPNHFGRSDEDHVTNDTTHFKQIELNRLLTTQCDASIILESLQEYVARLPPSRRKRSSEEVLVSWLETSAGLADAAEKGGWETSLRGG